MYKRLFTSALIFGAAALAPPAAAQNLIMCAERVGLIKVLQEKYQELPRGAGLQGPERMIEIWTSSETGSFTVLVTRPDGISCVVASGSYWQDAMPVAPDDSAG